MSSYHALYNLLWMNNGYHAEHHYRPKPHWTEMKQLHLQFAERQRQAGVHVLRLPHALGFLENARPETARQRREA